MSRKGCAADPAICVALLNLGAALRPFATQGRSYRRVSCLERFQCHYHLALFNAAICTLLQVGAASCREGAAQQTQQFVLRC
ncbi:Uncharacterised protein [Pseudomonas putida]|uniref:Uncharacterized protein n=1 Tax=Pseudomonas putida TaxID=303 RepID=A0A379KDM1_PSEPU|nr:Uncharacterised protein [Pseudomonas putida]